MDVKYNSVAQTRIRSIRKQQQLVHLVSTIIILYGNEMKFSIAKIKILFFSPSYD